MTAPRRLPALLLALVVSAAVQAQDKPVIPPVDMKTAQAMVDTLSKENETLGTDTEKLRREAVSLTDQLTLTKKWINDLTPILAELKARNADLASLAEALADRGLKARSAASYDKNKANEKKIAQRMDDLAAQVADLGKQVEARLYQAAVNDARLARNTDDIILLQATITKTKVQEARLTQIIDQVDTLGTKVDSFLQQSSAALGAGSK